MYHVIEIVMRVLPALVIYGGTASLLFCAYFEYRWGVLMSLMMYSFFMLLNSWEIVIFAGWGIFMCWLHNRSDWYDMYNKHLHKEAGSPKDRKFLRRNPSDDANNVPSESMIEEVTWQDVVHVVMVPNYKTPYEVLADSLRCLETFNMAKTNLAVCLAFEEREEGCKEKADQLKGEFSTSFKFVTSTFHPPNLPNHVPGKSSNECWAFTQLQKELRDTHGYDSNDPRVVITVIDDDSELHPNYFEALNYHFLKTRESDRYLTLWQPPICHFKNYTTQPFLVRTASLFTTLHELACLANPVDCHIPFSSYSLSLILASAVGGWDPDFISEDWHMMAKCALMTEGQARCQPIFLPLLNYAPEESTVMGTIHARWTQATRHALGVSEIVYVGTNLYVALLEIGSFGRRVGMVWRMLPLLSKFVSVHFTVSTLAFWPLLINVLINIYMWRSWCDVGELGQTCETCCLAVAASDVGTERVVLDSWTVFYQRKANVGMFVGLLLAAGWGCFYFRLVMDRVDRVDGKVGFCFSNPFLHWIRIQLEVGIFGWISSVMFGSLPEWIACVRIMWTLKFHHVVAGMVGRDDEDLGHVSDERDGL